jgi:hypothetical protein
MKMTDKQMKRMAEALIAGMKRDKLITFKEKEDVVVDRATAIIRANFAAEEDLNREVNKMMDDLERQNPGGFQRYIMFPMLKKRLAKEKKFVL